MVFEEKVDDNLKEDESHIDHHAADKHEVPSNKSDDPFIMTSEMNDENTEEVSEEVAKLADKIVKSTEMKADDMTEEKAEEKTEEKAEEKTEEKADTSEKADTTEAWTSLTNLIKNWTKNLV